MDRITSNPRQQRYRFAAVSWGVEHIAEYDACFRTEPPIHAHPYHQLLIPLRGRLSLEVDRQRVVAERGRVVTIRPRTPHHAVEDGEPDWVTYLDIRLWHRNAALTAGLCGREADLARSVAEPVIDALREGLWRAITDGQPAQGPRVMTELWRFASSLPDQVSSSAVPPPEMGFSDARLRIIANAINDLLQHDISVDQLAGLVDLSPSQLNRVCRSEVGLSPMAWVTRIRLDKARQLVIGSTLSMKQIAQHCGLGHANSMNRVFQRHFGVSPRAMRRGAEQAPVVEDAPGAIRA